MKIDIHAHTRKCKSGDAHTREISPENFREAILSTEVRIIAVTNHNVFALEQYTAIKTSLGEEAQVWPGIELDILEEGSLWVSRSHFLHVESLCSYEVNYHPMLCLAGSGSGEACSYAQCFVRSLAKSPKGK